MKLTPMKTLAMGAGLILLVNAVALTGVAFNRSGEPESRITLTERELSLPWRYSIESENSGMGLHLAWRVGDDSVGEYFRGGYGGGTADWLDEAHMKALGFDTTRATEDQEGRRRFERQLPRQVLLVLELAGPAWQAALERARQNAIRHEAASQANAGSKEFAERAKRAQEASRREEIRNSRLFAIDAGLDAKALRARYPDRGRYLILEATVRPRLDSRDRKTRITGYVGDLAVAQINVPHAMRPALEPLVRRIPRKPDDIGPGFEAAVAVGQRLEPWIETVAVSAKSPP